MIASEFRERLSKMNPDEKRDFKRLVGSPQEWEDERIVEMFIVRTPSGLLTGASRKRSSISRHVTGCYTCQQP